MEGVGARLGRSSSRYGTTTVFNGPVRKWKKDWVPINPSSSSSSSNSSHHNHNNHHHRSSNGTVNGSNGSTVSHLRLYKWTPLNKDNSSSNDTSNNKNSANNNIKNNNDDVVANGSKDSSNVDTASEEPPRRKFKYIPIAVLEEQKKETEESTDGDEVKPVDSDENNGEQASKSDGNDEKPDINDTAMEENQAVEDNQTAPARQDLNELDLSLGLTSHDDDHDSDSKSDPKKDVQLESSNSGS